MIICINFFFGMVKSVILYRWKNK